MAGQVSSKTRRPNSIDIFLEAKKASISLDVIIVGGGVAGMAAAFALGRAGHNITVVEASSTVTEIGAGIQVGPSEPSSKNACLLP